MSTILLVEDDRNAARLLRTLFELENHHVVVTPAYQEVVPALRQVLPDAVLMDVLIQGQETIELVRQMRQEEDMTHIPVVMTSGMDCRWRCLEAGADLFVLKPFLPDQLVEAVIGLLKR